MVVYVVKSGSTPTVMFPMVAASDHIAVLTGITPTVNISKNGGAFAATTNAASEIANGWYKVALTATETNTNGQIAFHCTGTGADPTQFVIQVVAVDLTDAAGFGLSRVDAAISTRSSHTAADVWASATRTLSAFGFGVTVTTNNDKTGYALSAAAVQAIWDALTSALSTANSIGKLLVDNINATISSRLPTSSYTAPPSAASISTTVWAEATRSLTDKAGFALSSAGVQAIWDAATSALTTAGSIGKLLVDNINATISSRLASASYTAPDNTGIDAIEAAVSSIATAVASVANDVWAVGTRTLSAFGFSVTVGTNNDKTGYRLSATGVDDVWDEPASGHLVAGTTGLALSSAGGGTIPTAAEIAAAVLDEPIAGHLTAGSVGAKINAAGAGAGAGAIDYIYTLTRSDNGLPIADAEVWVTTDASGTNLIASGRTAADGTIHFFLDAGTYYIWRQKTGYSFTNPDTEVIS